MLRLTTIQINMLIINNNSDT